MVIPDSTVQYKCQLKDRCCGDPWVSRSTNVGQPGTYSGKDLQIMNYRYLWLRRRIFIEVHFAKVISTGKQLLMM